MDYVSITWNDVCITFNDTAIAYPYAEQYIVFVDSLVEQICATNWGDGTGIKPSQAAQVTNSQFGTTFQSNTQITSFDELQYFTGLTQIPANAFDGCSLLESIVLPNITAINAYAFRNCSALKGVIVPSSVISFGNYAFYGCTSVKDATFEGDANSNAWYSGSAGVVFGDKTGTLTINGSLTLNNYGSATGFLHYYIKDDLSKTNSGGYGGIVRDGGSFQPLSFRVGGNITSAGGRIFYSAANYGKMEFLEVGGTISGDWLRTDGSGNCIMHLGYEGIAGTAANCAASATWLSKIYVGDGSSAAHDNAILALYTADSGWSAYSSKLDTWYNYVNDPNANQDYIN